MQKKLHSQAGESIGETLVAMLIVVMTFSFLTGAVVAAARVNTRLRNQNISFDTSSPETLSHYTITVSSGGTPVETLDPDDTSSGLAVTLQKTENGYYYYEVEKVEEPAEP